MKIVSWNVNGIRASYEKGLELFIREQQPDILCLQETKAHIDQVRPEMQSLGYEHFYWSSAQRKGYSGVATFSRQKPREILYNFGRPEYEQEGRIVITSFEKFDLYNIYFPNGGSGEERHLFKQRFLKELNVHLEDQLSQKKSIVLVGDYNVAHTEIDVHDPVRLSKESGFLPEERQWMSTFLQLGFVDTFRHFYPRQKEKYSWWSYRELARPQNRGWRIDYVCISKNLLKYLRSAQIHDQSFGSDHCPVSVVLEIGQ